MSELSRALTDRGCRERPDREQLDVAEATVRGQQLVESGLRDSSDDVARLLKTGDQTIRFQISVSSDALADLERDLDGGNVRGDDQFCTHAAVIGSMR